MYEFINGNSIRLVKISDNLPSRLVKISDNLPIRLVKISDLAFDGSLIFFLTLFFNRKNFNFLSTQQHLTFGLLKFGSNPLFLVLTLSI